MSKQEENSFLFIFGKTFFICATSIFLILGAFYGWRFYQKTYEEKIVLGKGKNIEPKETLEIFFAVPVLDREYKDRIKIEPKESVELVFDEAKRKITITPKNFWKTNSFYTITLPEGRTAMLTNFDSRKLFFSTAGLPQVKNVSPGNKAIDVIIGAEDPIVVDFDKSTAGYFIDFTLSPKSEVVYQNNEDKTQFKILPKGSVEDGIEYELKISAKVIDDRDENYQLVYNGTFETLKMEPVVWEKDLSLRLEQARKYTRAKIREGKYLDINLTTQIMSMFEDGKLIDSFLISSGQRGMETKVGETKIYNKAPRPFSKMYGLYMPFWMALVSDGKWGIHELPEWPGGYKEGANHLGIPVSHGCVRLGVGPAEIIYNWSEIGMPVVVY